jgi:hypothetical protein
MANHPVPGGVAIDLHVEGRIGEYRSGTFRTHQRPVDVFVQAVAADDAVPAELPNIARRGNWNRIPVRFWGRLFAISSASRIRKDCVNLRNLEARNGDIKIRTVDIQQVLQFNGKDLFVPASQFCKPVVGEDVRGSDPRSSTSGKLSEFDP